VSGVEATGGGSSITMWTLVPPMPNELTPARRGMPVARQSARRVFT